MKIKLFFRGLSFINLALTIIFIILIRNEVSLTILVANMMVSAIGITILDKSLFEYDRKHKTIFIKYALLKIILALILLPIYVYKDSVAVVVFLIVIIAIVHVASFTIEKKIVDIRIRQIFDYKKIKRLATTINIDDSHRRNISSLIRSNNLLFLLNAVFVFSLSSRSSDSLYLSEFLIFSVIVISSISIGSVMVNVKKYLLLNQIFKDNFIMALIKDNLYLLIGITIVISINIYYYPNVNGFFIVLIGFILVMAYLPTAITNSELSKFFVSKFEEKEIKEER